MEKTSKHFFALCAEFETPKYKELEEKIFESQDHQCIKCKKVDKLILHNEVYIPNIAADDYCPSILNGYCFHCYVKISGI